MRLKKYHLDSVNRELKINDELLRDLALPKSSQLTVELIEIANVLTPSELTFKVRIQDKVKIIPLCRHRAKFLFQNGLFILDTTSIKDLDLDISSFDFSIMVETEAKDFKLTMYCVTDQSQPFSGIELV